MKKVLIMLFIAGGVLVPGPLWAQVPDTFREYVTYGGFHSIHNALSRIALSFSGMRPSVWGSGTRRPWSVSRVAGR